MVSTQCPACVWRLRMVSVLSMVGFLHKHIKPAIVLLSPPIQTPDVWGEDFSTNWHPSTFACWGSKMNTCQGPASALWSLQCSRDTTDAFRRVNSYPASLLQMEAGSIGSSGYCVYPIPNHSTVVSLGKESPLLPFGLKLNINYKAILSWVHNLLTIHWDHYKIAFKKK